MCKFIKVLSEKLYMTPEESAYVYNYDESHLRQFEPIQIDEHVYLSIQASYAHRCTPQKTIHELNSYTHWEFAFLYDDEFVRAKDVTPDFFSLAELELYFDGSAYTYVPTDLVEELFVSLK